VLIAVVLAELLIGASGAQASSGPLTDRPASVMSATSRVPRTTLATFLHSIAAKEILAVSFKASGTSLLAEFTIDEGGGVVEVDYSKVERGAVLLALVTAGYTVTKSGATMTDQEQTSPWWTIGTGAIILGIWLAVQFTVRYLYRRRVARQAAVAQGEAEHRPAVTRAKSASRATSKAPAVRGREKQLEVPTTRFSDIGGAEEAVEELSELVTFLKEGDRFFEAGADLPHGYLLVGPPGTGKTLLARAVAGEADVPFFAMAAAEFVETYVGVGAARVRKLFEQARAAQPAIIFIDEIDAMGRERVSRGSSGNDERDTTLNQLLVEMDGFVQSRVVVLGATNRPEILDPALVRAGRFDRQVMVPPPDRRGRTRILELYLERRNFAPDLDVELLARRTPGFTGADLSNLVNTAARLAVRAGTTTIDVRHLEEALSVVTVGPARKSAVVAERDRRISAWHETGHALAGLWLEDAVDPVQVTIVPRGLAGGFTWFPASDDAFLSRRQAKAQLVVAMAGRVAEELLLDDDYTQGAAQDFKTATELARVMVTEFGMSSLGPSFISADEARFGALGQSVMTATNELLDEAITAARELLTPARAVVARVAETLLDAETLDTEALVRLAGRDHDPAGDNHR
jgi:cell division protease FtsH